MIDNLFVNNTPDQFWHLINPISDEIWSSAINKALLNFGSSGTLKSIDDINNYFLGETRFGNEQWRLGFVKQVYYMIKPLLPRKFTRLLRKGYKPGSREIPWPVEDRYINFLCDVLVHVMKELSADHIDIVDFWPENHSCAMVLTHDIESAKGQAFVREVANLESELGFYSSFNFVPERYEVDHSLISDLKANGFEIGIHGLKHDGKLFFSEKVFSSRVKKINQYLKSFNACGFRSPLMHRQPQWLQQLEVLYDLSFFDTDPYEAIPGGCGSIFPYEIGNFIELPYTLVQDYSLINILGQDSPKIWLDKITFLEKYHGMILVNVHPDYLLDKNNWSVYSDFLQAVREKNYWYALPKDVALWWKKRMYSNDLSDLAGWKTRSIVLSDGDLKI